MAKYMRETRQASLSASDQPAIARVQGSFSLEEFKDAQYTLQVKDISRCHVQPSLDFLLQFAFELSFVLAAQLSAARNVTAEFDSVNAKVTFNINLDQLVGMNLFFCPTFLFLIFH